MVQLSVYNSILATHSLIDSVSLYSKVLSSSYIYYNLQPTAMMAVSRKRSASHAFSIDSLMRTDRGDSTSPAKTCSITPPSTPPHNMLSPSQLMNIKAMYENPQYMAGGLESMGLALNHPIFAGALPATLPGHMPNLPPAFNPALLLAGAQRDSLFNPWLQLARNPNLLAHRLGKFIRTILLVFFSFFFRFLFCCKVHVLIHLNNLLMKICAFLEVSIG